MWITGKHLGRAWTQTRKFFKDTYHEGRKWAHTIDSYAQLFRRGLSAAAPMLQDLGAGEALGSGVRALQSYDTVRKQVMDVDERGREHLGRIAKAITQKNIAFRKCLINYTSTPGSESLDLIPTLITNYLSPYRCPGHDASWTPFTLRTCSQQ